jgi:hypothetical protein
VIVVKPNDGTEGNGVEAFTRDDEGIVEYILDLKERGYRGILLQERRGNIRYLHPEDGRSRSLDFRINVAWDGEAFRAESGYAQVGEEPESFTSSAGRGGKILSLREVIEHLIREELIVLDGDDRRNIEKTAVRAAEAINGGYSGEERLLFMGIDVKLEIDRRGCLTPVVLDVNPRPAGLGHSRFLRPDWGGEAGVTLGLWAGIEGLKR